MKTIKTEWFQHQNEYLKPNSKEPEELYWNNYSYRGLFTNIHIAFGEKNS